MQRTLAVSILAALVIGVTVGCGENDPFATDKPRRNVGTGVGGQLAPLDAPAPPPPPPANDNQDNSSDTTTDGSAPPPPPPAQPKETPGAPPSNVDRNKAQVGADMKRGQGYGSGLIATPVATYFSIRQQLKFMQVQNAMRTFKTLNGRPPESHEEFMKEIIEANQIALPDLRSAEHKYVYDPTSGELMVEKPR